MGYRSILRSVGSAMRQAERDAVRRQRELEKRRVAYEKMQALEQAAYDVEVYENYLDRITSLHKDCISNYDWEAISQKKPPKVPEKKAGREIEARSGLEGYKPSFIDKLFKLENKKRKKLIDILDNAIKDDATENKQLEEDYKNELIEYTELIDLAKRILQGDTQAYKKAVEDLEPLSEISEIGSKLDFAFVSKEKMIVTMAVHEAKVVPKESKSLLKSGKLSTKDLPIGKYNELYQDYVCSSSLRVAREMFGLLPVDEIIIHSKSKLLSKTTGRIEDQVILSVRYIRETMKTISFENINPSDSMSNFIHNMGFKKSQGMSVVEALA